MTIRSRSVRAVWIAGIVALALLGLAACSGRTETMSQSELVDFATRYAAAWSGQNADELASFYAEDGTLAVNDGAPAVGTIHARCVRSLAHLGWRGDCGSRGCSWRARPTW